MEPTIIMASNSTLSELVLNFDNIYSQSETFLEPSKDLQEVLIGNSKHLYDFMKEHETISSKSSTISLRKLLTNGFDNEQIWQEIQLQNKICLSSTKNINKQVLTETSIFSLTDYVVSEILSTSESENEDVSDEKENVVDSDSSILGSENEAVLEYDFDETEVKEQSKKATKIRSLKRSKVDDKFFNLQQMQEFLDEQDRKEVNLQNGEYINEEDDIDYFQENVSEDGSDSDDNNINSENEKHMKYDDFFGSPTKLQSETGFDTGFEEEDSQNSDEVEEKDKPVLSEDDHEKKTAKSAFEHNQEEMSKKIRRLEESNLSDKPWQLKGETTAKQRPVNSLLEEHVSFDHTSVGAPIITEETTETLEDIIKQRIKDQAWDDVERKLKPNTQPYEYKKAPELNMEKSKLSLAEVYEKEYLKQAEDKKEDEEKEEHKVIKELMDKLFINLDALSNFCFTPKPPRPQLKIVTNTPSIQMEEVTPITMTTASQLAPEEIFDKKKGDFKEDSEKLDVDRMRERRQKKTKKRYQALEKERKEKLKAKNGNVAKSSKKKAIDMLKKSTRNTIVTEKNSVIKNVKSSNEFFTRLQDEAKKSISGEKLKRKRNDEFKKKTKTEALKL